MKFGKRLIQSGGLFLLVAALASLAAAQSSSTIYGQIFDAQTRRPVGELYVELQDRTGFSIARGRIDSSGRFMFRGLRGGTYNVRIMTGGTNYEEVTQEVQVVSMPLGNGRYSSDNAYVEIYMKLDKRLINTGSGGAATVIFAQEVPDEARKLYKKGVEQLDDKKDEGLGSLGKALDIFPTYYDALDRLGREYVLRNQNQEAAKYLIRAIDVNQRSYSSFYALGIASYNLKQWPEAIEAMRAATIIDPKSINAQLFYGMVLRIDGRYPDAEKALLQAKKLTDKLPNPEVHWQLALLYQKTGREKMAADELELYLKVAPKEVDKEKIKKLIETLRAKAK